MRSTLVRSGLPTTSASRDCKPSTRLILPGSEGKYVRKLMDEIASVEQEAKCVNTDEITFVLLRVNCPPVNACRLCMYVYVQLTIIETNVSKMRALMRREVSRR